MLSRLQVAAFRRDGFVVVKGLIDAGQVRELLADYDRALRGEIEVPAFGDRRVKGSMVQLANPSRHMAHWRDHAYFRRALAAARQLIGPEAEYQYDQLIMKPAHYPAETDWHQDAGYWQDRNGSDRAATCWLALTPAWEANGGMQFIPGSHLGPIQEHVSIADRSEINGALATARPKAARPMAVTLEPGDATFHHCRTLHYAGGNATDTPRYGVITHFWSAAERVATATLRTRCADGRRCCPPGRPPRPGANQPRQCTACRGHVEVVVAAQTGVGGVVAVGVLSRWAQVQRAAGGVAGPQHGEAQQPGADRLVVAQELADHLLAFHVVVGVVDAVVIGHHVAADLAGEELETPRPARSVRRRQPPAAPGPRAGPAAGSPRRRCGGSPRSPAPAPGRRR